MVPATILDDLDARGLVHDTTDRASLADRLADRPLSLYCGFDPTADSLHLGNLVPLLLLRRFQLAGHRPIALAGGATGMIGDPGGRSSERNLLDADTLAANTAAISAQLSKFLDFEPGPYQARLVDNRSWTEPLGVIEFLRDVGKHTTIQQMLARDAVRQRLDSEHGLSFTEFSYMLLQAHDYFVLHRDLGCELQVAGSDQWGNIVSGVDLIRRRSGVAVHALVAPLITRADGQKFGKSVDGALWLDPERTRPFQLFQYLVNVADDDVERFLLQLTLVPVEECLAVAAAHRREPSARSGQRRLAGEVVGLVHGAAAAASSQEATDALFGHGDRPSSAALAVLERELPSGRIDRLALLAGEVTPLDAVMAVPGLAKSRGEVRRNPTGYALNGRTVDQWDSLGEGDLLDGRYLLVRRGRSGHGMVVAS